MLEIVNVLPRSKGAEAGLQTGDAVVSINGNVVDDVIDYKFFTADEHLSLVIQKKDGARKKIEISKEPDDGLGLEFGPLTIKRCRNKCIFCFVDQMPPGCRKTLYVKDDDFRASFLYGNFITLGALSDPDWRRIFSQRLSPLYISVHTTDDALRASILRNRKAPGILSSLKRLARQGIRMHTQVVLCPGINDGDHLEKTITDLAGLYPAVSSIAVVPVGITSFREKLFPLKTFSRRQARSVLERIDRLSRKFKQRFGTRLVFASDEFYIKAGEEIPAARFYEDFPQIENGVGLVASFMRDVSRTRIPRRIAPIKATVVTGISFSGILRNALSRLKKIEGAIVKQITIRNRFFGRSVTVAGLLTGADIIRSLKGKRLGDIVFIPSDALKEGEDIFLDNMSLKELEQNLGVTVSKVENFSQLIAELERGGKDKP